MSAATRVQVENLLEFEASNIYVEKGSGEILITDMVGPLQFVCPYSESDDVSSL